MTLEIQRPPQQGDFILITYGRNKTLSFFSRTTDTPPVYHEVCPSGVHIHTHQYKSQRGAIRLAHVIAFTLGKKIRRVDGWGPKPPPNFESGASVVFFIEP